MWHTAIIMTPMTGLPVPHPVQFLSMLTLGLDVQLALVEGTSANMTQTEAR